MPLRVVESHRFKVFVQALDPNFSLPSRKHLSTTLLEKKYSVLKKAVIRRLEAVRDIHLTRHLVKPPNEVISRCHWSLHIQ